MTVQQLIDKLNQWGLDRNLEIDVDGNLYSPTDLDWDADRRCVFVRTAEAPSITEPYMYEDEEECPDCGNIVEKGEACFCGE